MNEQKNSFLHRIANSPIIRYCNLVSYTHGSFLIKNMSMCCLITIGFALLHIVTYSSMSLQFSVIISRFFMPIVLTILLIIILVNTSKVFYYLHNKRNISLFHTLPISQAIKFFVLCMFVYVFQTIVLLLVFMLLALIVSFLYSFVDNSITLFYFRDYYVYDLLELRGIMNYFTGMTCFFLGAIYFNSMHVIKTLLVIVMSSFLLSFMGGYISKMDIFILKNIFFFNSELTLDFFMAIIINGVGIPLVYIFMKKHSIVKVK